MAKVTITFDNGPEPPITHHVLDVLAQHGIKTSFYVIGRKMESEEGRAAVVRAKAEGHWIGNHSYSHSISLGASDDFAIYDVEVTRSQEIIGALAHPDRLFRPFCNAGVMDTRVFKRGHIQQLAADGYTCVMFNALTRDWEDREGWVARGYHGNRITALDDAGIARYRRLARRYGNRFHGAARRISRSGPEGRPRNRPGPRPRLRAYALG